jgi:hypothetical protein
MHHVEVARVPPQFNKGVLKPVFIYFLSSDLI